jgi:hypothetical protein
MPKIGLLTPVVLLGLLACGDSEPATRNPKPPGFTEAFSKLPLPPKGELVSRSGGAGALQIVLRTQESDSVVAEYYRTLLSQGGWRLVSDIKNQDGATAMYAEQDGPPLWVRIWPAGGGAGTMIQLTGAALAKDSLAARKKVDSSTRRRGS